MVLTEDPNMKAKKARTWEKQKKISKVVLFALKWFDGNSPISPGLFGLFFISLYSKTIQLEGINFSCITVNVHVGLSSERETATAKYVGVNKLIREILIKNSSISQNVSNIQWLSYKNMSISQRAILKITSTDFQKNLCSSCWL